MDQQERLVDAIRSTQVLRPPQQTLATFGITTIHYYLLTEPVYADLAGGPAETVIREGQVVAEKPKVVTPSYLFHLDGFGEHARDYLQMLMEHVGPHVPGLLYAYRNEMQKLSIVANDLDTVAHRINDDIERDGNKLAAIVKGVDDLWDVSLIKFISDLTNQSAPSNFSELSGLGHLRMDGRGIPFDARMSIEKLFDKVGRGEADPTTLKRELDRWGLWADYQDRFLNLFRRNRR